jgi:predicted transcriptional regulator
VQDLARHGHGFRKSGPLVPAVPIEDSIKDDYIVCLEDGKKLQMLKRHLNTVYKMSIDEYRERWGLAPDYPVVAPNYARRRSQIAKNTGLGQTGRRKRVQFVDQSNGAISQVAAVSK